MKPETSRGALLERREALQRRLREEEERRPLAALLAALDAQSADYELIGARQSFGHPSFALLSRAPNLGSGIDWSRMENMVWLGGGSEPQRRDSLVRALEGEEGLLLLTWDNGALPSLLLRPVDIVRNAFEVLHLASKCWILDPHGDWLVEAELRGDVRRGTIPG